MKNLLLKAGLILLIFSVNLVPSSLFAQVNEDPDLPALPNQTISKEEYLSKREQYISNLRGNQFLNENTFNARAQAIE